MKKQYVTLLAVLLTASVFLLSCDNKMKRNTGALEFDSIRVNQTVHLFGDTAKPACNLVINYTFPVKSSDEALKDSLNILFASACFGDKYADETPQEIVSHYSESYVNDYRNDLEPMYLEDKKDKENEPSISAWYSYYKCIESRVQFYQKNLLVYRIDFNEYTGGAHGIYTATFMNIDLETISSIQLDDLFIGEYDEVLTDLLWKQLIVDNKVTSREELENMGYGSTGDLIPTENFYLDDKGIAFYYNVYEFTPYVMGPVEIKLPYSSVDVILKDESIVSRIRK